MHSSLLRFLPSMAALATIVGLIALIYAYRTKAMRALAARWGMRYLGNHLPGKFPLDRRRFPIPANHFEIVLNVIAGECNGKEVLIFDSIVGGGKGGRYCTFFTVRTEGNLFGTDTEPWKLVQSNGWIALWRLRFWQIPWTMSIEQIESHLRML